MESARKTNAWSWAIDTDGSAAQPAPTIATYLVEGSAAQPAVQGPTHRLAFYNAQPGSAVQNFQSLQVLLNLKERRVAMDGAAYTFEEYVDYYGFQKALTLWQTNSAEQPVDTIVGHPESHAEQPGDINSAEQPVGTIVSNPESRGAAEQPVRITAGHPQCQDEQHLNVIADHTQDSAAQPAAITASQPEQQDILLSWNELDAMRSAKGCGGKAACQEQRRLRKHCFDHGHWDVDLSKGEYDWKQLLKALPSSIGKELVGAGIVKFSFRLLRNVRDHNYCKVDSGEKPCL